MSNVTPDTPSGDYKFMRPYWDKVTALYLGADAVREGGEAYLPRFEGEPMDAYKLRLRWARYTNIYADILNTLSSKPFSEEVRLDKPSPAFDPIVEDIDGQGNNLHNFAKPFFKSAINLGLDWIFVDYTQTDPNVVGADGKLRRRTVAEERAMGARPYWVRVPAKDMIAVYSVSIGGVETFVHCRIKEVLVERKGWEEVEITQIRELDREVEYDDMGIVVGLGQAVWRIYRENASNSWEVVDEGVISIGEIPIVPLVIGEREGTSWRIVGEMKDCADLQLDLYQQETELQNARRLTAFPMLSAEGIDPPKDNKGNIVPVPVGPRAVLYGGRAQGDGKPGSWKYIEISATSLNFLASEIKETKQDLRELGRQPLTAQTGNLTTVTTAFAAQKGNSAAQAWAFALRDALEQAFVLTAKWMKTSEEPNVFVFTDFEAGLGEDDGFDKVQGLREKGDLSRRTAWNEAVRRGILSDSFDPDDEEKTLREERDEDDTPADDEEEAEALGAIARRAAQQAALQEGQEIEGALPLGGG